MPQRQLNIRSDEAVEIAAGLAKRLGRTTTDVVIDALRSYRTKVAPLDDKGMTPEQRAEYEALRELSRRTAAAAPAGMTSDHSWLYDEYGLPK